MQRPIDDSIGSMSGAADRSILFGQYFWEDVKTKFLLNISGSSKDLSTISIKEKNNYFIKLSLSVHILILFILILQVTGLFCIQL